MPDCVRAALKREPVVVRNPLSTRPYQHVLEALYAYLMIAAMQQRDRRYAGSYNVGPDDADCCTTGALAELFVRSWGEGMTWLDRREDGPRESGCLRLDCTKLKETFGWRPRWNLQTAVDMVVTWSRCWAAGEDVRALMDAQMDAFLKAGESR